MGLVLAGEGGGEVQLGDAEEEGGYVASVGDCLLCVGCCVSLVFWRWRSERRERGGGGGGGSLT